MRPDAGPGVGGGHLARSLALVQGWVDTGGTAVLVADSNRVPGEWLDRYRREGVDVTDVGRKTMGDWYVLDGYRFGADDYARARERGRLLVIDDHGRVAGHAADLVVDHNPGASAADYPCRSAGVDVLLGSRYALVRRQLRDAAAAVATRPVSDRIRLLVTLGAEPARPLLDCIEEALGHPALAGLAVEVLDGRADVVDAMVGADLALAGAGVTATELCVFGVPAVLLAVVGNQEPVAAALEAAGAAVTASPADAASIARALTALVGDHERRGRMAAAGRALVDGRGALRVVVRLRADLLRLRPATGGDASRLFEWANDPVVRYASFSSAPIPWDDHVAWVEHSVADPSRHVFIVEGEGGEPIGQVRLDVDGAEAEISVGLGAQHRGRALGPAAIDAGVRRLWAETPVTRVVARIRSENRSSVVAFGDAGFLPDGKGTDGSSTWLRYSRCR